MRRRMAFACALLAMATVISGTGAASASAGFKTSQPSMLTPVMTGVTITPLLTVGDVLPAAATSSRPSRTASPYALSARRTGRAAS